MTAISPMDQDSAHVLTCHCGMYVAVTEGHLTDEVVRMFVAGHTDSGHSITEERR